MVERGQGAAAVVAVESSDTNLARVKKGQIADGSAIEHKVEPVEQLKMMRSRKGVRESNYGCRRVKQHHIMFHNRSRTSLYSVQVHFFKN